MAENRYLGRIISTGTSVTNATTTGTPFVIPPGAKLTMVADAAGRLLGDNLTVTTTVGAQLGLPISAGVFFPTSAGRKTVTIGTPPAQVDSAVFAWISNTGTANLDVWQRVGDE